VAVEEHDDDEDVRDDQLEQEEAEAAERDRHRARAERQLSRGRIRSLGDRLTGGPERPGEQKIGRSPFVLGMIGAIAGLALLSAIFYYIINTTSEQRTLEAAMTALEQQKYGEAEQRLLQFLQAYPKSDSSDGARIALHRTRVEKLVITDTPDVINGIKELKSMLQVCRDLEGFDEQKDNVRRYADRLTYAGAFVANVLQQQEPLDVSIEAMEILRRYSGEGGIPRDREEELIRRQRIAEASILKRTVFVTAISRIRGFLDKGDSISAIRAREDLIERYDVFQEDRDVASILDEILNREQELSVREESGKDAVTTDRADGALPALSPTLRTQARNDLVSQGRIVFAVGIDCCLAVDADTGEPIWRRVIGTDSPFAPLPISGATPALLTWDTTTGELMLLSQSDGSLLWRQKIESAPIGEPLIHEQQIFLTTRDGRMTQIAASSGRIQASIKFTQKIIGPPALSRDGSLMIVPGDDTLVYTLTTGTLSCKAASFVPHRAGSVQTPVLTTGEIFLMCDNDTPDRCRLRTLELNAESGRLTVRSTDYVNGAVRDPCLLRGRELFVPSAPQRITAFRVTDEPDQPPLAKIGSNQLEDGDQTQMFLLAGPGGQLWLAGRSLRKFQTRTNAVLLDSARTAEGVHLQPIQFVDESVFLTSRDKWSSSVFFTRADREQMRGQWRTIIGNNFVSIGPAAGGQSLLAVTDFGEVYRIPFENIKVGGFWLDSISRFRLPDKLASSVRGLSLKDGRLAAWCGAEEPALWTITSSGQLERRWSLPGAPEADPVALGGGVVVPLPGRLHLTGISGIQVEDYRVSQGQGKSTKWKFLTALSDTQVLAVTSDNQLVRVEYRANPRPQLAEVSVTRADQAIEVAPTAAGGLLFTATADGQLVLQQAGTLEVLSRIDLGGVPSASPSVAGNRVFVEVARQQLKAFSFENELVQTGTADLNGFPLAGTPYQMSDGTFVVARSDGNVDQLDSEGNSGNNSISVGQSLVHGPIETGGMLIVIAADGTLYPLPFSVQ
jgi:PQQ-like domain